VAPSVVVDFPLDTGSQTKVAYGHLFEERNMMNRATRLIDILERNSVSRRFLLAVVLFNASSATFASGDVVSLDAARAEHEAGRVLLIDIREPDEHARGVARGARLMPMSQLRTDWRMIPKDPKQPVLLICNTQNRSSAVLKALKQEGYTNIRFVQGGMAEWARRGWPMVVPSAR
jgi:rhodanese-related sulfurtransferase